MRVLGFGGQGLSLGCIFLGVQLGVSGLEVRNFGLTELGLGF